MARPQSRIATIARRAGLLLAGLVTLGAGPLLAQDLQLERSVVLSRHGVRSPIASPDELASLASSPWPVWPTASGDVTPRGAELMTLMGSFYREAFSGRGLISPERCPKPGMIAAWADVDQRTRVSAQALLDGLYPHCGITAQHQADLSRDDPLFHPVKAGVCAIDPARAERAILDRVGGRLQDTIDMYSTQYNQLQSVLCPASSSAGGKSCGLWSRPTRIVLDDGRVVIRGPIRTASVVTELFLLESAQGMPKDQVAWGRLRDDAALRDLMFLHTLDFDLSQRTAYLAKRNGSAMLSGILARLQANDDSRLVFLVGHDTNLSNVAGLLGIHWVIPGFQPDDTTPGGALAFDLLKNPVNGERFVRLVYVAQTLEQMRNRTRLDFNNPAARAEIELPGCSVGSAGLCPWPRFLEIARQAIDAECVPASR